MKNLQIAGVLTILILAIVIISGCTNNAGSSGVPSTQTQGQDPIIGVWRNYFSNGSYVADSRFRFNSDNTFKSSFYSWNQETTTFSGTWINQGSDTYALNPQFSDSSTTYMMIYNPSSKSFYLTDFPSTIYTRYVGAVMTAPTRTKEPTQISKTEPISADAANIIVNGYWKAEGGTDPVPVLMHIEAVNIGRSAGINVQVEVTFLYNNQVVKSQKVYFGTINAGETVVKDQVTMINFPTIDAKLIEMKFTKTLIDGQEAIRYKPE